MNNIKLKKIVTNNNDDCHQMNYDCHLTNLLNNDKKLQLALGSKNINISIDEFIHTNYEWCKSTNSELFAIVLNDAAIGTISLSKQDMVNKKSQIGYWIGSSYWNNGYTTAAFKELLNYAKSKNMKYVTAKIQENNIASIKIWQNVGADIKFKENYFYVALNL